MASAKRDFTSVNFCTCQILSATGLPVVTEFNHIMQIPAEDPLPSNARLIGTPVMGDIASAGLKTVGVHRTPQEISRVRRSSHYSQTPGSSNGPNARAHVGCRAICLNHSVSQVAQRRSEVVRRMISRAQQLQAVEETLRERMSQRRREILRHKKMLLFKELLVEACSQDVCLSDDTCNDFDLTGKLLASNHFDQRYRPASYLQKHSGVSPIVLEKFCWQV